MKLEKKNCATLKRNNEITLVVVVVVVAVYNHGHRILKLHVNMLDITMQISQM